MKNKTTRLGRWKAAMCAAALVGSAAVVAQSVNGGYAGPVISPSSLDFGTVAVGSTSAVQTVNVSAYGGYGGGIGVNGTTFSVNSITLAPGYIRSGGTCVIGVNPSTSCTIGIAFQPITTGLNPASIAVNASTNGLPGSSNIAVIGIGGDSVSIPALGNLGLLLMLAGVGAVGLFSARRN